MSGGSYRVERELASDPTLIEAIMSRPEVFPPMQAQPELVLIRADEASVEIALARALAVAVSAAETRLKLEASMPTKIYRSGHRLEPPSPANGSAMVVAPPAARLGWPEPAAPEAYYGLAGDVVRAVEPHSEADPVALLCQILTFFGNVIGAQPRFRVESDFHRANLYGVLVGETGKGRKGTSKGRVKEMFATTDGEWQTKRILSGLSSGEGLIWSCRDPIMKRVAVRERGRIVGYENEEADPGIEDKRLLVIEPEFARVLKMASRDGNILSEVIREAYDSGDLRSLTKNMPASATGAHISIIGHITRSELLRCLGETEQMNGFGNRFMWLCVRRSKYLPDDEDRWVSPELVTGLQARIKSVVEFARGVSEMRRDEQARLAWRAVYARLSDGKPGLVGAMLGRAEAQVLRLSMVYALADKSSVICLPHLKAALALWEYCERSATYIFGDALGDPTADTILAALRNSRSGLTRTEISALFRRHKPTSEIARALSELASLGLAGSKHDQTDGRAVERWEAS